MANATGSKNKREIEVRDSIACHYTPIREFIPIVRISGTLANMADARSSRREKSARDAIALLLSDIARRGHRHPEMRARTSPRKDKSTALRATHSPEEEDVGVSPGDGLPDQGLVILIGKEHACRVPGRRQGARGLKVVPQRQRWASGSPLTVSWRPMT
jgi:hypothetical protein